MTQPSFRFRLVTKAGLKITMMLRMTLNSPSSYLSFLSSGIKTVQHHAWQDAVL